MKAVFPFLSGPPCSGAAAALVGACLLLASCTDGAGPIEAELPTGRQLPQSAIVTDAPFVGALDGFWKIAEGGGFQITTVAAVQVWINQESEEPLEIRLESDGSNPDVRAAYLWDNEPLAVADTSFPDGVATIVVPAALATVGGHELRFRRDYPSEVRTRPHDPVVPIRGVVLARGDEEYRLDPDEMRRHRFVGDFLAIGVAGQTKTRRAGILFDGPGASSFEVDASTARRVSAHVENAGDAPATFELRAGSQSQAVEVPPGEVVSIGLTTLEGLDELELEVSSSSRGPFLFGAPWIAHEEASRATPVFLVTLDTTRRDALSPYGGNAADTPHIERFASQATIYDHAYSTAPWTLPSHASMLTGEFPSAHGAGVSQPRLHLGQTTLVRKFSDAGYRAQGFVAGELASSQFGLGHGFHTYRDPDAFETVGDRLMDGVLEFLDDFSEQPIFSFINLFDPHAFYWAPEPFRERVGQPAAAEGVAHIDVWKDIARGEAQHWPSVVYGQLEAPPAAREFLKTAYRGEVAFLDEQLGRLFAKLEEHDLYERALIVLIADHGESIGEDDYFGHSGRPVPVVTDIPLLVKLPFQSRSRRANELVSSVDVFATLLQSVGLDVPSSSSVGLLADQLEGASRPYVLIEEHLSMVHPLNEHQKFSDHVYVLQSRDQRRAVWKDGGECRRRDGAAWEIEPCSPRPGLYDEIHATLGPLAVSGEVGLSAVDSDLEKALKALGYL